MSVVSLYDLKEHLAVEADYDDALLQRHLDAAQSYIASFCGIRFEGYRLAEPGVETPDDDSDDPPFDPWTDVPAPLKQAIRLLAGHFYANREAVLAGLTAETAPFGVHELCGPYREWVF